MKPSPTSSSISENMRVLFFLLKKLARITLRWATCVFLGIIAWLVFEPLPAAFLWIVIIAMLGSMSIHTILHRQGVESGVTKQASRYVFFLSFPMLFVFAGNRLAVWGAAEEPLGISQANAAQDVRQGVVPSEEYLLLKALQKEGFKNPKKAKKGIKKTFRKYLLKYKEMDKSTRTILIVFGIILLLLILFLVLLVWAINDSVDSCAGSSSSNDTSCCME